MPGGPSPWASPLIITLLYQLLLQIYETCSLAWIIRNNPKLNQKIHFSIVAYSQDSLVAVI